MCDTCTRTVCPAACPEKRGHSAAVCGICNDPLYPHDGYYVRGQTAICHACADCLSVDDLIALGSLEDTGELLTMLGFQAV